MRTPRRQFLAGSAAALFTIVPRHVLGGGRFTAPSDKLRIAGIGVGGMGAADLGEMESENIVALCDVDERQAAGSFARYAQARRYRDFREMLAQEKDLDAVVVATPDHVHAVAAMAAIEAGKHVYCEKPMSHTMHEARQLTLAARRAGVATQMGNQGHATESIRRLCEWIWDGAIGDVHEVHAWTPHPVWPQEIDRPQEVVEPPATLHWDLWLGPAPYRPYHPAYLPATWRGWQDFGTGGLGDMGCHVLDHVVWSLKLAAPSSVEATHSTFVPKGLDWNKPKNTESYPRASMVTYRFPRREGFPPCTLQWYDGGLLPPRPEELADDQPMGDRFGGALYIGTRGKILCGSHGANGARLIPDAAMQAYRQPKQTLPRSIGHRQEWIAACKGGAPAGSNFEYAGPLTETVLLGNIALKLDQKLYWDSEKFQFKDAPEADKLLHREYRDGWKL
jgi:predicted dehydrogenase